MALSLLDRWGWVLDTERDRQTHTHTQMDRYTECTHSRYMTDVLWSWFSSYINWRQRKFWTARAQYQKHRESHTKTDRQRDWGGQRQRQEGRQKDPWTARQRCAMELTLSSRIMSFLLLNTQRDTDRHWCVVVLTLILQNKVIFYC